MPTLYEGIKNDPYVNVFLNFFFPEKQIQCARNSTCSPTLQLVSVAMGYVCE
jgi:hypothetical protein